MSHQKCSASIVLGLLAIAIGTAPMLFASPTSQHSHDPQVDKDPNEGGYDGLKGFEDIEKGQHLYVKGIIKQDDGKLDDFILPGITVFTNYNTKYRGGLEGFEDLEEGQEVKVKGGKLNNGEIIAFEVKQKHEPRHPGFRDFKVASGLNMKKDITTFTYSLTGDGTIQDGMYAILGSESFDCPGIEGLLNESDKFETGEENGVTTFTTTQDYGEGIPPLTAGFFDNSTLLIARESDFAGFLATLKGEAPNANSTSPLGKLLAVVGKGPLFIAFIVTEEIKELLQKRAVTEPLSHAQAVSLSVGFTDENLMTLAYQADTIENAETIAQKFQGFAKPDDERTRDDKTLAIALSNLLKLWNPDLQLYDALNTFMRIGQVIIEGKSLQLSKIEAGSASANTGSDANRIRKLTYVLSSRISIPEFLKQIGISTGQGE